MNCPICNKIIDLTHWHTVDKGEYEIAYRDKKYFQSGTTVYSNYMGVIVLQFNEMIFLDAKRIEKLPLLR